ncbi:hypothetical protein NARC_100027 [Candidatus Nitrosocosmicus arcticus]|uniref:Uncharacterized protein n=1 Tax=Candidatus Nitrosocosmicus arcticus TaxID=2035267 RepID=A0A557STQ5_9ARCH|nr:hypothetical protein NARC_100027 [Candidatus Nitrosocosmicus arcticus]
MLALLFILYSVNHLDPATETELTDLIQTRFTISRCSNYFHDLWKNLVIKIRHIRRH